MSRFTQKIMHATPIGVAVRWGHFPLHKIVLLGIDELSRTAGKTHVHNPHPSWGWKINLKKSLLLGIK